MSLALVANSHSHRGSHRRERSVAEAYGCGVAASPLEGALIEQTALEPFYLWSGAPPRALQTKFLQAQPSRVTLESPARNPSGRTPLDVLDLRGHALGMVGFRTPDDVLFVADTLFPEDILGKYKVSYCADVGAALATLERLETLEAAWFVPCPRRSERGYPRARGGERRLLKPCRRSWQAAREPAIREELFVRVLERLDVALTSFSTACYSPPCRPTSRSFTRKEFLRPEFSGGRFSGNAAPRQGFFDGKRQGAVSLVCAKEAAPVLFTKRRHVSPERKVECSSGPGDDSGEHREDRLHLFGDVPPLVGREDIPHLLGPAEGKKCQHLAREIHHQFRRVFLGS